MIILTGTTGNLGSSILRHMLGLVPPSRIIASVHNRSAQAHEGLEKKGVHVRAGDYHDPGSLERAFAGGDRLLIVSHPSFSDELRVASHRNAIDAAKKAGVKHIYYTSIAFGGESKAAVMKAHLETEAYLRSAGVDHTIIREGVYMESYPLYLGFFEVSDAEVVVPGDGGVAWAARDDLAEATAKVIAGGGYKDETILLTGPRAYTLAQTTALVSSILGREIRFSTASQGEFVKRHAAKGDAARLWASTYPAIEAGELSVVDPSLERILGRPPVSLESRLRGLLGGEGEPRAEVSNWIDNGQRGAR
ncbi:SDR family oxidoreductase [Sorangium sp. So ce321]|uniref:SDR family oxidoreductase n=1 Tax=Sorangium sp. So ce321 TaxID=3133300 RepID=UPI003F60B209